MSELTALPLRHEDLGIFPNGQHLVIWLEVQDAISTWMLIESLVDPSKLVAGCRVRGIELAEKEKHRGIRMY